MDIKPILVPVLTAAVASLVTWAGLAGRKAIKNFGKTEVEIDEAELVEAEKAVAAAKLTPDDPLDDKIALAIREKAQRRLNNAKRWQALTDAIGDTSPSTPGVT